MANVYEILKKNKRELQSLLNAGVSAKDIKWIEFYEDWERLKNDGLKTTYIIAVLSSEYNISEDTAWRIIRKLSCNIG